MPSLGCPPPADTGNYVSFVFGLIICLLSGFAYSKMRSIKSLEKTVGDLNRKMYELDEQAKLIIKTDLELNKTQEELDRKITSLLALQHFSRTINILLEKESLFASLQEDTLEDLGFTSCLIFTKKQGEEYEIKKIITIKENFDQTRFPFAAIVDTLQKTNASMITSEEKTLLCAEVEKNIALPAFIILPLKIKDALIGAILLGNTLAAMPEGNKEIAEILATQINQMLENITLFEELYTIQRDLENRVKERTHDLTTALQQVERANRLKSEFISSVSHELRTPLTSIKGYAALLAAGKFGSLPEEIKTRLERINTQADMLVAMINDLLDIARIESGRIELAIAENDLSKTLRETAELLLPQVREKSLKIKIHAPDQLLGFFDKTLIDRALINLLSNAIKFTPEAKTIELSAEEKENRLILKVKDEGMGISDEDKENIFKEFYRTKEAQKAAIKGTGLGLSLVKNIVTAHKGTIEVQSTLGLGSTFLIKLPKKNV